MLELSENTYYPTTEICAHGIDGKLENTIEFAIGLASFHCEHLIIAKNSLFLQKLKALEFFLVVGVLIGV